MKRKCYVLLATVALAVAALGAAPIADAQPEPNPRCCAGSAS